MKPGMAARGTAPSIIRALDRVFVRLRNAITDSDSFEAAWFHYVRSRRNLLSFLVRISRFRGGVSHSHTVRTFQPASIKAASLTASRAALRRIFWVQNSVLVLGMRARRQSGSVW